MNAFTSTPTIPHPFWHDFTKRVLLAAIKGQRNPSIQKEWIMQAYADGHLSADEAEDYIVLWGLAAA